MRDVFPNGPMTTKWFDFCMDEFDWGSTSSLGLDYFTRFWFILHGVE
jgi:hypothetical protein